MPDITKRILNTQFVPGNTGHARRRLITCKGPCTSPSSNSRPIPLWLDCAVSHTQKRRLWGRECPSSLKFSSRPLLQLIAFLPVSSLATMGLVLLHSEELSEVVLHLHKRDKLKVVSGYICESQDKSLK